jgi:site-specific DNA-cytosine methylase
MTGATLFSGIGAPETAAPEISCTRSSPLTASGPRSAEPQRKRSTNTTAARRKAAPTSSCATAASTPDGPRYRALGNSMAVPVMRWLIGRIRAVEALLE